MRTIFTRNLLLAATACCVYFLFNSCSKDKDPDGVKTYTYSCTINSPVYKTKSEIFNSINASPNTAVEHAGKLYVKDHFIFLNEVNKGIHVIDNRNPSHPVQVAFLSIPGNLDIAIKGNILYADMYADLLALDISDIHHVKYKTSVANFFTARLYPEINNSSVSYMQPSITNDMVAVDWLVKDTTVTYTYTDCNNCEFYSANASGIPGIKAGNSSGTAGSMAAMVIMNNYLYAISEMHSLGIVDITNPSSPKLDSSFFAGFDLETIYPFEDKLFLGSKQGVYIYDVSNPQLPTPAGTFTHGTACDPVIADGDYAYVTLHAGTFCGGSANELDVVNVADMTNSTLAGTYNLLKPTGLSKDDNLLFVCDSINVKLFDAKDPSDLKQVQTINCKSPYDAIASNNTLLVVAADGLYQYDYSNINNIKALSFFPAKE
jgi:hypothetical protein